MADKEKYEVTAKIYGGAEILKPGDVVELDPEMAETPFWKNRTKPVAGELKPAAENKAKVKN